MKFLRNKKRELPSVLDYETREALATVLAGNPSKRMLSNTDVADPTDTSHVTDFQEPKRDVIVDWKLPAFDANTTKDQTIEHELQRLIALQSYNILENERDEVFDRITSLAAEIFQVPVAIINLVDLGRTWFVSGHGTGDLDGTPRTTSFCAHVVAGKANRPLVVADLKEDFRFKDFPTVTGPPYVRFYAGAPLISPEGYKLGALCIMDVVPRKFELMEFEEEILMDLAAMAMNIIVTRRDKMKEHINEINHVSKYYGETCFDSLENMLGPPMTNMQSLVRSLNILVEPLPKLVPITIEIDPKVPNDIHCNDVLLLRASLLLLSHSASRTESGSITMLIQVKKKRITFECKDTGAIVSTKKKNEVKSYFESSESSPLSAMTTIVLAMNGEYGVYSSSTPKQNNTTIFWFNLPKHCSKHVMISKTNENYGPSLLTTHAPNQSKKAMDITSKMKSLNIAINGSEGICSMPDKARK